jgi:GNAT superfamily N-acetyltransferase
VTVRPAREEDLGAAAELVRALDPVAIVSAASLARRLADAFVAELDGELVGWAVSAAGWFFVGVRRDRRRRGLGSELFERIAERRRGDRLVAFGLDADGVEFLERRGFERSALLSMSVLDLRTARLPELPASELTVVPLARVRDRPRALYDLYMDTLRDVPNAESFLAQSLDEWRATVLDHPELDDRISVVVLDGERPVALAWLLREGTRAAAEYAATAPSHRGRGLATLAKLASTHAARDAGVEQITTENDRENAAMLAVNRRLGFEPTEELPQYIRVL